MAVKSICRWILFKALGWTADVTVARPAKCIICYAPHTSNTDFIIGVLYMLAEGFRADFLMKKEWFFPPMGTLLRSLGGIPVARAESHHMTDRLAAEAAARSEFCLAITPEGTRSLNPDWKRGFYYIALKAGLPVLLYGADYEKKLIRCTKALTPTGDIDSDMREIANYFKDFKGKHPERFSVGGNDE
ncbi:MAG: 1-acyl-sn-glycerol-3-phosphate acyltransferase [Prevotella sp.]|nr:1-acyl-sn-glycerol-3-phosphate acyltransferase [Prevotella sp.]